MTQTRTVTRREPTGTATVMVRFQPHVDGGTGWTTEQQVEWLRRAVDKVRYHSSMRTISRLGGTHDIREQMKLRHIWDQQNYILWIVVEAWSAAAVEPLAGAEGKVREIVAEALGKQAAYTSTRTANYGDAPEEVQS